MRVGYQGDKGSNAERATKVIVKKLGMTGAELLPLITSKEVVSYLRNKKIDFGVMAIQNSIGGIVDETKRELEKITVEVLASEDLPISHFLFKKDETILNDNLKYIASHEQALKQTVSWRLEHFSNLTEMIIPDTAIGAKWLYNGELDDNVAVICPKNIGKYYNICLISEIPNEQENFTKFILVKMND